MALGKPLLTSYRSGSAINRPNQTLKPESTLTEILAFENANTNFKRAIRTLKAQGVTVDTWIEWIRKTTGIGSQDHNANIIEQIRARNRRNKNVQHIFQFSKPRNPDV